MGSISILANQTEGAAVVGPRCGGERLNALTWPFVCCERASKCKRNCELTFRTGRHMLACIRTLSHLNPHSRPARTRPLDASIRIEARSQFAVFDSISCTRSQCHHRVVVRKCAVANEVDRFIDSDGFSLKDIYTFRIKSLLYQCNLILLIIFYIVRFVSL